MIEPPKDDQVIREISPNDVMYSTDPEHYFLFGRQAVATIERFRALGGSSPIKTILDLPCGHGRVMRHLRAAFPNAIVAACDVDRDAVDFCSRAFNAQPVYSTADLHAVPLKDSYDLIWCGSLFTHLHADQWRTLLRVFSQHLSNTGLLVFTTHGRHHADRLRSRQETLGLSPWAVNALISDYEESGFAYQNYPRQEGYGISLSSPSWVCSQIDRTGGLRLAGYHEQGWAELQDAVACVSGRRYVAQAQGVAASGDTASAHSRVEILGVEQHLSQGVMRGFLDLPQQGTTGMGFSMIIQGWVLGPDGPPQTIQIGTNFPALWTVPLNMPRPDLDAKMPEIPDASKSGFRTEVSLVPLPRQFELPVHARFADNSIVKVATIKGRRAALGDEPDASLLRPLMITTLGRTGSTRVVQLLSQHPSIVGYRPGEYEPRIASYWVSLLAGLAEPSSYHQALDGDLGDKAWWLGVGRIRPLPNSFIDSEIEAWQTGESIDNVARFCRSQINAFYERVARLQARAEPGYFIEKTQPDVVPSVLWDLYPSAREIVLVRDMRDMVASILAFNAKRGFAAFGRAAARSDEDFILNLREDVVLLIDSWQARSERAFLLRYEDLMLHPDATLHTVLDYLGFDSNEASVHRLLRDASAMAEPPEEHRTSRSVDESIGRWQRDLDSNLQRTCDEAFGDLLPVLGYK